MIGRKEVTGFLATELKGVCTVATWGKRTDGIIHIVLSPCMAQGTDRGGTTRATTISQWK